MGKVWDQKKLEAMKMLENGGESHLSSARFVRRALISNNGIFRIDTVIVGFVLQALETALL